MLTSVNRQKQYLPESKAQILVFLADLKKPTAKKLKTWCI